MTPHYTDDLVALHHGDCLDVMRELPDNSVDAVVTDPPYGLEFMGREWDGADGFRRSLNPAGVLARLLARRINELLAATS